MLAVTLHLSLHTLSCSIFFLHNHYYFLEKLKLRIKPLPLQYKPLGSQENVLVSSYFEKGNTQKIASCYIPNMSLGLQKGRMMSLSHQVEKQLIALLYEGCIIFFSSFQKNSIITLPKEDWKMQTDENSPNLKYRNRHLYSFLFQILYIFFHSVNCPVLRIGTCVWRSIKKGRQELTEKERSMCKGFLFQ